ncbi:MAG: anti-sigma factor [Actinomycetes bacterium]
MPEDFTDPDLEEAEYVTLISLGHSLTESDFELTSAPTDLWAGIEARVSTAESQSVPTVVVLSEHRNRNKKLFLAAAAVVLLVVGGAVGIKMVDSSRTGTELVASADLTVLEGPATAQAKLLRSGDSERLVVTAENMPAAPVGSHYELWLVDPQVTKPQSLGPMTGSTEVTIPASIDTAVYPVVDISLQQNGTHDHSGHSLLRGTLQ